MGSIDWCEDDLDEVDEMLRHMPVREVAPLVPMSEYFLRSRCRKKGITPVPPRKPGKPMKPKDINEIMQRWGR